MARRKTEIDQTQLEQLAALQCTFDEMAAFFHCDKSTLSRNYNEIIKKGREKGKMSLRRSQIKLAEKSAAMAIWLGKQYLGQKDEIIDIVDLPVLKIEIINNENNRTTEPDNTKPEQI